MSPPPDTGDFTRRQSTEVAGGIADRITKRALLGMRYDVSLSERVIELLKDLEAELLGQLLRSNPTGVKTFTGREARKRALLALIQPEIGRQYRKIASLTQGELFSLAHIEQAATQTILTESAATVGVSLGVNLPTDNVFAALFDKLTVQSYPLRDWWNGQSVALFKSYSDAIGIGVTSGESVDQIARRVAGDNWGDLRRVKDDQAGDVIRKARRGARTLVRTSVASVQGQARQSVYDANLDVIEFFCHVSRLDSRTSDICIARAGKRWEADTKKPVGHSLPFRLTPLHPSCRSVIVPIPYGGGQLTHNIGADEWLKNLSAGELDTVLGIGKAKLYRTGKFKAVDLITKDGEPLTLEQLAAH